MSWLFEDPAALGRLQAALAAWHRTPFFPRMAVRGAGVDCVRFALTVLQEVGAVGPVAWPRYSVKGGGPALLADVLARLESLPGLRCLWRRESTTPMPSLLPGDLLVSGEPIHLAIVDAAGELWHALFPAGVQHGVPAQSQVARIVAIFRAERSSTP